jgi:hypothetical protein
MPEVVLFAGPSAHGIDPGTIRDAGVRLRPPARRGDVQRLVDASAQPGVLILCDGVFQAAPAVSHAELCAGLDAGWQVWGVSSIGAIRAHEMRDEGMVGFGEVYAMFGQFEDFTDDEMCLLHFPEPPWFPVTEALVNVRYALARQGPALGIGADSARALIAALRRLWFGDRSPERIRALMLSEAGCTDVQADGLLAWLETHRVKTLDLERLLQARPWRHADPRARTP